MGYGILQHKVSFEAIYFSKFTGKGGGKYV
jgi:hypothetical protein